MVMRQVLKLKRKLPERQWKRLSSAIKTLTAAAVQPFVLALKLCPDVVRIEAKAQLGLTRKMDYTRHDIRLAVDSLTEYATRLHSCKKEPETIQWIETFFKRGDVFFDVGANVGAYSLVASKFYGGAVKVYTFEPAFPNFAQLCRNIFLNGCSDSITPLQVALSDRTDMGVLSYNNVTPGGSLHALSMPAGHEDNRSKPVYRQSVLAYRVDDLVSQFKIPTPNHLKLDVDGTELQILKGADATLSSPSVKSVLVELDEAGPAINPTIEFLAGRGLVFHSKYKYVYAGNSGPSAKMYNYIFHRPSTCICPDCSAAASRVQA